jgi:hypothetical protein
MFLSYCEKKCGATVHFRVCPDASVVAVDDASDGGETDSGAFEVLIAVQAVEGIEEFVGVVHVEAGSVVLDEERLFFLIKAKVNDGLVDLRGKLGGVSEEIFESDPEELGVAVGPHVFVDGDVEVTAGVLFADVVGYGMGEAGEVDRLAGDLGAGDARELEEGVDELPHALDAGAHAFDIVAAGGVDGPV